MVIHNFLFFIALSIIYFYSLFQMILIMTHRAAVMSLAHAEFTVNDLARESVAIPEEYMVYDGL